jgi:hypothetical protein
MKAQGKLLAIDQAAELIRSGKYLCLAGDEVALRQLPRGNWIGGTIPYFMTEEGGVVTREKVFVNEIDVFEQAPILRRYDTGSLPQICRDAPDHGYTILIVPAFGPCHHDFAENSLNYEDMYMKPLLGWVAGVHLDDLGKITPKVVLGSTGEFSDQLAVAMDVPLPPDTFANVDTINLFHPGGGDSISFASKGFSAGDCLINERRVNLAEYMQSRQIDKRLPLVAESDCVMVNVGIKAVDIANRRVEFYAPVFPGLVYQIAAPVADYVESFQAALPHLDNGIAFSCNCILNYLHSGLEGKRTAGITGPITFGEISYQLLNQTLVYLYLTTLRDGN